MKKVLSMLLVGALTATTLAGCGGNEQAPAAEAPSAAEEKEEVKAEAPEETPEEAPEEAPAEGATITVAAIETAYGSQMWQDVCAAFTEQTGINVELITDKNLEDVIGPSMQAGDFPDVIHLATGREKALTETFIDRKSVV